MSGGELLRLPELGDHLAALVGAERAGDLLSSTSPVVVPAWRAAISFAQPLVEVGEIGRARLGRRRLLLGLDAALLAVGVVDQFFGVARIELAGPFAADERRLGRAGVAVDQAVDLRGRQLATGARITSSLSAAGRSDAWIAASVSVRVSSY